MPFWMLSATLGFWGLKASKDKSVDGPAQEIYKARLFKENRSFLAASPENVDSSNVKVNS